MNRNTRTAALAVTALTAVIALTGCGEDKTGAQTETTQGEQPTTPAAIADPTTAEAEEGIVQVPLGKPGNIVEGVTMTVLQVKPNLTRETGGQKMVGILVDFHNTSGKTVNVGNSWDYKVVDAAGQTYESDYVYKPPGPLFQGSRDIATGRHAKGWMIYDQPAKTTGAFFQYQDMLGGDNIVEFALGLK